MSAIKRRFICCCTVAAASLLFLVLLQLQETTRTHKQKATSNNLAELKAKKITKDETIPTSDDRNHLKHGKDFVPYPNASDLYNSDHAIFKFDQYMKLAQKITPAKIMQAERINTMDASTAQVRMWKLRAKGKIPLSSKDAISLFSDRLPWWEIEELSSYQQVWYMALGNNRINFTNDKKHNFGFSYSHHDYFWPNKLYKINVGDHIAYRYKVEQILGKGGYGVAVQAYDFKTMEQVVIKMLWIDPEHWDASVPVREVNMLAKINSMATSHDYFPAYIDSFIFRNHVCLVMELLGQNLEEVTDGELKQDLKNIPVYLHDILHALSDLHSMHIVHADFKRENLAFSKDYNNEGRRLLKLVDFSESCIPGMKDEFKCNSDAGTPDMNCPEISMWIPFNTSCDMFSVGIYLLQASTGIRYFKPPSNNQRIQNMIDLLGLPPKHMMQNVDINTESPGKKLRPSLREIVKTLPHDLADLISKLLVFNPQKRLTAKQALKHEFLSRRGL